MTPTRPAAGAKPSPPNGGTPTDVTGACTTAWNASHVKARCSTSSPLTRARCCTPLRTWPNQLMLALMPCVTTTEVCRSPTCSLPWTGPCTTGGSPPNLRNRSTPNGTTPDVPKGESSPKRQRNPPSRSAPPTTTPTPLLKTDSGLEKDGQDAQTNPRHAA